MKYIKLTVTFLASFILGIIVCFYLMHNYYSKRETAAINYINASMTIEGELGITTNMIDSLPPSVTKGYKEAEYQYRKTFNLFEDCADDGSNFTWGDFFRQFL